MAGPRTSAEFLDLLRKSGLASRDKLAAISRNQTLTTAQGCAASLVRQGELTPFQAECLSEGFFRGFLIDRYKVLDILGGGGMGVLYLAEHVEMGERVALKVLGELFKHDPAMRARFAIEARAGSRLNHPNAVSIRALGETDDLYGRVPFIALEFIEGAELQELVMRNRSLPKWPQACDMIQQAAGALHHAHEAGLVHRDVKPSNLLLESSGNVRLLDFGLALSDQGGIEDEFSLSLIFGQGCVGTDDYIAPEQIENCSQVDRRADIYSLGCTLYFALTGRVPFPVKSQAEKLRLHQQAQPTELRSLAGDVPETLASIVDKMMAKKRDERFQTAAEVQAALVPFAKPQPIEFHFPDLLQTRKVIARQRATLQKGLRNEPANSTSRTSITSRFYC